MSDFEKIVIAVLEIKEDIRQIKEMLLDIHKMLLELTEKAGDE